MLGGSLYCWIIGGVFLLAGLFAVGMVFWMYVTDRWKKKDDPEAPGFMELDRRGRTPENHRGTETQSQHREDEKKSES